MALTSNGYADIIKDFQSDTPGANRRLKEAFDKRELKATEFDFGRLFEAVYGWHDFRRCKNNEVLATEVISNRRVQEGPGAVGTDSFLNISGQIVYSAVLDKYQTPDFVMSGLIPTVPTQFLDGEKMAGVTQIGDEALVRDEYKPYVEAGVTEDYIYTPALKDRGDIVSLTWEAIFSDRTGQLLERAGDVGTWLGVSKEKRAVDCVIDENTTTHRYNWKNLGAIASYGDNSGNHSWDNLAASNALVDWTDIDNAEQLFNAMTDPYTGEPFTWTMKHLIVTKQLEKTALRIRNATEVTVTTPGYATSGDPSSTKGGNPVGGTFDVVSSQWIAPRLGTDTSWFLGDIGKYAKYMQAEPINVIQSSPNATKEFENRIVTRFRANERGAFVVVQPRAIVKSTA